MLRIHFMQQWLSLSDPAMEEALHDITLYREFALLGTGMTRLADESTILRFRHLLETHELSARILATVNEILQDKGLTLRVGSAVDATLISAPSSTKKRGTRDPEMRQTQKGGSWSFGMKTHIGVDVESGLVHTVKCTSANVHDITVAHELLHDGDEQVAFADAGYVGIEKRGGNGRSPVARRDAPEQAQKAG